MNSIPYLERIKSTLEPISHVKRWPAILHEWVYTRHCIDHEEACAECELCGHLPVRFRFEIRNSVTGSMLLVGSSCIRRFGISDIEYTTIDRREVLCESRRRSAIAALVNLARFDEMFDFESFIEYLIDRGAFTPNQVSAIIWRLEARGIQYRPDWFPVVIRREREKEQLLAMPRWQVERVWPCLSLAQRKWFARHMEVSQ